MAYVDLDERAIDALREFNEEGALTVLQQFKESDLSHVQVGRGGQTFHFPRGVEAVGSLAVSVFLPVPRAEQKCVPLRSHENLPTERKARQQSAGL